jgi:hypothetical protein
VSSQLKFEDLIGLDQVLTKQYRDLSPSMGYIMSQKNVLHNLRNYFNFDYDKTRPVNDRPLDSICYLIKKLFTSPSGTLAIGGEDDIGKNMTFKDIGVMIGIIHSNKDKNSDEIEEIISKKARYYTAHEDELKKEISEIDTKKQSLTKDLRSTVDPKEKKKIQEAIHQIEKIRKIIDNHGNLTDIFYDAYKDYFSKKSQNSRSFKDFLLRLDFSLQQLRRDMDNPLKYPPDILQNIVLGFLWIKAETREDLKDFFDGLFKIIPKAQCREFDTKLKLLTDETIFNQDIEALQKNQVDDDNFYERMSRILFWNNEVLKPHPVSNTSYSSVHGYQGDRQSKNTYSNCAEASVMHTLNILLYDPYKKGWMMDKIQEASLLKEFYRMQTVDRIGRHHKDFSRIICDLNVKSKLKNHLPITYLKQLDERENLIKSYNDSDNFIEIKVSLVSMILAVEKLFNRLFAQNLKTEHLFDENKLKNIITDKYKDFFNFLSTDVIHHEGYFKNINFRNNHLFGDIVVKTLGKDKKPLYKYTWSLNQGHGYIDNFQMLHEETKVLRKKISKKIEEIKKINLHYFFNNFDYSKIIEDKKNDHLFYKIMESPTDSVDNMIHVVNLQNEIISKCKKDKVNVLLCADLLSQKVLRGIPFDDPATFQNFSSTVPLTDDILKEFKDHGYLSNVKDMSIYLLSTLKEKSPSYVLQIFDLIKNSLENIHPTHNFDSQCLTYTFPNVKNLTIDGSQDMVFKKLKNCFPAVSNLTINYSMLDPQRRINAINADHLCQYVKNLPLKNVDAASLGFQCEIIHGIQFIKSLPETLETLIWRGNDLYSRKNNKIMIESNTKSCDSRLESFDNRFTKLKELQLEKFNFSDKAYQYLLEFLGKNGDLHTVIFEDTLKNSQPLTIVECKEILEIILKPRRKIMFSYKDDIYKLDLNNDFFKWLETFTECFDQKPILWIGNTKNKTLEEIQKQYPNLFWLE